MSLLQQKSLVPLLREYKLPDEKLPTAKHKQDFENGLRAERKTTIDDGIVRGPVEGIMLSMRDFRRNCKRLNVHNEETFENFGDVLQGPMQEAYTRVIGRDKWQDENNLTTDHDADHDNFVDFVNDVVDDNSKIAEGQIKKIAMAHLRKGTQSKPRDMAPIRLEQRIDSLEQIYADLRPYDQNMSKQDWKEVFFDSMPEEWKNSFASVPRDINKPEETLTTIQQYMTMKYEEERKNRKRSAPSNSGSNGSNGSRRSSKRRRGRGKKSSNSNGTMTNPCKREGCKGKTPHDWSECFYNRNGNNYKPQLKGNKNGQGGNSNRDNNGNGKSGSRQDNHVNDSAAASASSRANVSNNSSSGQNDNHYNDDIPSSIRQRVRDYLEDTDEEDDDRSLFSSATKDKRKMYRQWLKDDRARRGK